jgi:hypothetical protein
MSKAVTSGKTVIRSAFTQSVPTPLAMGSAALVKEPAARPSMRASRTSSVAGTFNIMRLEVLCETRAMRRFWLCSAFVLVTLTARAQGVAPEWEVKKTLEEVSGQTKRFAPLVQQLKPAEWVQAGAPEAYVAHRQSLLDEIGYLDQTLAQLGAKPGRMSLALQCYTRMGTIESRMMSLIDAVRRYQNPALADLIQSIMGETAASRDKLRQYAWELVASREQEFEVLEQEAQRCRNMPARPSVARPGVTVPKKQ